MTEFLASAAEKMGVPEPLVQRSAEARAKAAGASTDDILAAWAGGEAAPAAAAPPPADTPEPETADTETPETEPAEPAPAPEPSAQPAAAATGTPAPAAGVVAARASAPPVLVGRDERLVGAMAGAVALLALSVLVGFFVASTPEDSNLAYSSEFAYSEVALDGQDIYLTQGCSACHTQVVRPLVADAGFGGVTMSDTNQIVGTRRIGPDLTHIGSRVETDADLYTVLEGGSGHPPYGGLGQANLDALVTYLMESK